MTNRSINENPGLLNTNCRQSHEFNGKTEFKPLTAVHGDDVSIAL